MSALSASEHEPKSVVNQGGREATEEWVSPSLGRTRVGLKEVDADDHQVAPRSRLKEVVADDDQLARWSRLCVARGDLSRAEPQPGLDPILWVNFGKILVLRHRHVDRLEGGQLVGWNQ
jgi:hypothetical protein